MVRVCGVVIFSGEGTAHGDAARVHIAHRRVAASVGPLPRGPRRAQQGPAKVWANRVSSPILYEEDFTTRYLKVSEGSAATWGGQTELVMAKSRV